MDAEQRCCYFGMPTSLCACLVNTSNPSISQTTEASPRNIFSKNRRFMSLTHRYISKEHNMANLCTASPGPKYCQWNSLNSRRVVLLERGSLILVSICYLLLPQLRSNAIST